MGQYFLGIQYGVSILLNPCTIYYYLYFTIYLDYSIPPSPGTIMKYIYLGYNQLLNIYWLSKKLCRV